MSSSERQYPSNGYAWYTVIVLTIAYILSFVDRYILGLLIEPIKADLDLTDSQVGYLLGLAFSIVYATAGLYLGYLADRKRRTFIVAAGIVIWSLATAASGLAKNFWQLFVARMTVGAGEATLSPCTMSMISDSFPREKRGKPIAFYTAALSLGAGIASLVSAAVLTWTKDVATVSVPLVGDVAPWQFIFIIVGLPGILIAALVLTLREPVRQKTIGEEVKPEFSVMLAHVRSRWMVYGSLIYFVCVMTICAYLQQWYAPMFKRTWGWEAQQYAAINGVLLLLLGPVTVNMSGWMNDKFFSKGGKDAPLLIVIIGVCILVPTGVIAPLMPTPELAMAVLALNTVGIAMASATGVTALMNITPSEIRGQTVALYYMVISLSGAIIGPTAVGWLSDFVFGNENLNLAAAVVPAVFGIPAILLIRFTRRSYLEEIARQEAIGAA